MTETYAQVSLGADTIDELLATAVKLFNEFNHTSNLGTISVKTVVVDVKLDGWICSPSSFEGYGEYIVAEDLSEVGRFDAAVIVLKEKLNERNEVNDIEETYEVFVDDINSI